MKHLMKRLWQEDEGQDLVEYGLLLLLVALIAVASIQTVGQAISQIFSNASTNLTAVAT